MPIYRSDVNDALGEMGIDQNGVKEVRIMPDCVAVTHFAHDAKGRRLRDEITGNFPLAIAVYKIEAGPEPELDTDPGEDEL